MKRITKTGDKKMKWYMIFMNKNWSEHASEPKIEQAENKAELRKRGYKSTFVAGAESFKTRQDAVKRAEELK